MSQGQVVELHRHHQYLEGAEILRIRHATGGSRWRPSPSEVHPEGRGWNSGMQFSRHWSPSPISPIWEPTRSSTSRSRLRPTLSSFRSTQRRVPSPDCSTRSTVCSSGGAPPLDREWCSESHPLLRPHYRAYTQRDYDAFLKEYFIVWNEWGPQDFGMDSPSSLITRQTQHWEILEQDYRRKSRILASECVERFCVQEGLQEGGEWSPLHCCREHLWVCTWLDSSPRWLGPH